jgi:hypothetical protein
VIPARNPFLEIATERLAVQISPSIFSGAPRPSDVTGLLIARRNERLQAREWVKTLQICPDGTELYGYVNMISADITV